MNCPFFGLLIDGDGKTASDYKAESPIVKSSRNRRQSLLNATVRDEPHDRNQNV